LAALFLLLLAMTVQKIWAADTWWQLATGRWIVQHRAIPRVDPFSYTAAGREWIELRWLFCLATYLGWQTGGPNLLIAGQVTIIAATWAILVWPSRRALALPFAGLIIALGLTAGLGRWVLRPELITYLLTAVYLCALERLAREAFAPPPERRGGSLRGWWLPLVQVLWVNAHTLFILGPVLCWLYTFGDAAQRLLRSAGSGMTAPRINRRLAVLSALVTLSCLANPYLARGALFPLTLWREIQSGSPLAAMIGEFQSPFAIPLSRWTPDLFAAAVLILAAAATFAPARRRLDVPRLTIFIAVVYLACKAQRNAGLLAIVASWAALRNLDDRRVESVEPRLSPGVSLGSSTLRTWSRPASHLAIAAGCVALAWYVATDRLWVSIGAPRECGLGIVRTNTPEETARFLQESGARGPIFNAIGDGGYFAWAVPGLPVFVDGRLEVYGERFLVEHLTGSPDQWRAMADASGINTAMIPTAGREALARALANSPDWKLVHLDWRDFVFVRVTPSNAALIAAHAIDLGQRVEPPPAPPTGESPDAWKRALGAPSRPSYYLAVAEAYFQVGSLGNAARFLDAALQRAPHDRHAVATLLAIERFRHQPGAEQLAAQLTPGSPWAVYSDQTLAELYRLSRRAPEAIAPLERIVEARPSDRATRIALADLYFQLGDFARAREHYYKALGGSAGPAPEWKKLGYCFEQTQDPLSAADAYHVSLGADPNQPDTWFLLGRLLAGQRRAREAEAAFRQALTLKPDYPAARQALDALGSR
jgi:tetratricopeptide (TPR) repeat protein